ncbi:hypothetical protein J8273_6399 [Carpediemonas membranifera]|uniref:Calcineurin-like phosphoesterase domain-containing protein n=1 Tax=Carpediemonas membranifera TaxID=201153 RepID=A0A8J6B2P1_9EUKA|nr:hypothetical protein J8273_6399 [Carpediemonas membranifera]|eukprot:KAG9391634.1 hypothetical protein J8273_6399 [Carpediemonas membranifera]
MGASGHSLVAILSLISFIFAYELLVINDVHYSPYYKEKSSSSSYCEKEVPSAAVATFGRYNCDAPMSLISASLDVIVDEVPNPFMLLIGGDLAGHTAVSWEQTLQSITDVTNEITKRYPHAYGIPVIGNDDGFPDYHITPSILADLASAWSKWLMPSEQETFKVGGYYKREVSSSLHIIVINTLVVISRYNQGDMTAKQFAWLESEVAKSSAAGASLVLVGHIPPGVNGFDQVDPWTAADFKRFSEIVKKHEESFTGMYFFHEHADLHRVFGSIPMFISPSITPTFGNNPSFRTIEWDHEGNLVDLTQYYSDLMHANYAGKVEYSIEYKMSELYGRYMDGGKATAKTIKAIQQAIFDDGEYWADYFGRSMTENAASGRAAYGCAMVVGSNEEYASCLSKYPWKN